MVYAAHATQRTPTGDHGRWTGGHAHGTERPSKARSGDTSTTRAKISPGSAPPCLRPQGTPPTTCRPAAAAVRCRLPVICAGCIVPACGMLASTPVSCTCGEREGGAGEGDVGASARLGWHAVVAQATCPRAQPSTPRRRWLWSRTAGVAVGSEHAATLREEELRELVAAVGERRGGPRPGGQAPSQRCRVRLACGAGRRGQGAHSSGSSSPHSPSSVSISAIVRKILQVWTAGLSVGFCACCFKKRVFDILMFRCPGAAPPAQRDRPAWSGNGVSVG